MSSPSRARFNDVVGAMKDCRILVIGDVILDRFVWGSVERISPEAPVPVVLIAEESAHLGGAANVSFNVRQLGAEVLTVGVISDDPAAAQVRSLFEERGLDSSGLVRDHSRRTTTKTRVMARHQQICRTDWESAHPLSTETRDQVLELFDLWLPTVHAVILSDYAKGVLTPEVLAHLIARSRREEKFLAVDPKSGDFASYRGANVITPNLKEAETAARVRFVDEEALERASQRLLKRAELDMLLLTRGEQGMSLFRGLEVDHIPAAAREVFDVTGAGDTVISAFTLAIAAGADPLEAAFFANQAAGIVVGKLGTAQATAEEVAASFAR